MAIGGFRQVPFSRCEFHRIPVPFLRTAFEAGAEKHLGVIQSIMESHKKSGTELVYSSAFTIRKEERMKKDLSNFLKELYVALTYADMFEQNYEAYISYAVLRFKVQNWYPKIGYQFLGHGEEELPPLKKDSAGGELVKLIYMKAATNWAKGAMSSIKPFSMTELESDHKKTIAIKPLLNSS